MTKLEINLVLVDKKNTTREFNEVVGIKVASLAGNKIF